VGGCHGRYQQDSVFELDEWERRDHFFSGADPADREYFLLNGNQQLSDDEEEEEVEKEEEEEEEKGKRLWGKIVGRTCGRYLRGGGRR
jgi:hypothetical protein